MKDTLISEVQGASLMRGTTCVESDTWTLSQAAAAEANSVLVARAKRLQTAISPDNGVWVSWDEDHDAEAKAVFDRLVQKIVEEQGPKFSKSF